MAVESNARSARDSAARAVVGAKKKKWQKPTLEDVSDKVMAQPYIRFT